MSERDPAPEGDGPGEAGDGAAGGGGGPQAGADEPIYTPTNLGDYEIREGEYGPLDSDDGN